MNCNATLPLGVSKSWEALPPPSRSHESDREGGGRVGRGGHAFAANATRLVAANATLPSSVYWGGACLAGSGDNVNNSVVLAMTVLGPNSSLVKPTTGEHTLARVWLKKQGT